MPDNEQAAQLDGPTPAPSTVDAVMTEHIDRYFEGIGVGIIPLMNRYRAEFEPTPRSQRWVRMYSQVPPRVAAFAGQETPRHLSSLQ